MQHGIYIAEFERQLFRQSFAISHHSLADLSRSVDFSKLKIYPESDRATLYEALIESIADQPRGIEEGIQILGEDDAHKIIYTMSDRAKTHSFASSRIRDIWCMIFIGGCP